MHVHQMDVIEQQKKARQCKNIDIFFLKLNLVFKWTIVKLLYIHTCMFVFIALEEITGWDVK